MAARPRRPPPDNIKQESAAPWPPARASSVIRAALGSHAPRDKEQHPASPKSESKHTAETAAVEVVVEEDSGCNGLAASGILERHHRIGKKQAKNAVARVHDRKTVS